jgi:hypothetical protein
MFVNLWEYEVKPGNEESFESAYGPTGAWVQLFRRDPHYRFTRLLKDISQPSFYLTLDCWDSEAACLSFKSANQGAYEAMDQATEVLTIQERHIGSFLAIDTGPSGS